MLYEYNDLSKSDKSKNDASKLASYFIRLLIQKTYQFINVVHGVSHSH